MTTERDRRNELAYSREEELKEGMETAKKANAEKLRELGVSEDIIAKATNSAAEEK